jgi:hypothetical protein
VKLQSCRGCCRGAGFDRYRSPKSLQGQTALQKRGKGCVSGGRAAVPNPTPRTPHPTRTQRLQEPSTIDSAYPDNMEEIAKEYDVIVLGTGKAPSSFLSRQKDVFRGRRNPAPHLRAPLWRLRQRGAWDARRRRRWRALVANEPALF